MSGGASDAVAGGENKDLAAATVPPTLESALSTPSFVHGKPCIDDVINIGTYQHKH